MHSRNPGFWVKPGMTIPVNYRLSISLRKIFSTRLKSHRKRMIPPPLMMRNETGLSQVYVLHNKGMLRNLLFH